MAKASARPMHDTVGDDQADKHRQLFAEFVSLALSAPDPPR